MPSNDARRNRPKIWLLLALLLCTAPAYAESGVTVRKVRIADEKTVAGNMTGQETAVARARVGGTVTRLMVERGSWVKKGQLLAVVVDNKLPGQQTALSQQMQAVESRVKLAELNLKRMESLLPLDAASPMQVEQAQAQYQGALAEQAGVKSQYAQVSQGNADGKVVAPLDGLVTELNVVSGSVVMPGETLAEVAVQPLLVKLQVPERHAHQIKREDEVTLTGILQSNSPTTIAGKVSRIYPSVSNGSLTVEVSAENLEEFKVGEKLLARLQTGSHTGILLPENMLMPRNGLVFVKLKQGTDVVVQPGVKREDGQVEILSGLNEGDVVVQP